jgi:hypothetical protein
LYRNESAANPLLPSAGTRSKQYDEILANAQEGYGDDRPLPARPEFVVKHMVMGKPLYRAMQVGEST